MLTIRPQPRSYMPGSAARASRKGASNMTRSSSAKRSGGNSCTGATCCSPALLTRMSVSTRSVSRSGPARSTTSTRPSSSWATRLAPSASRSSTVTSAPAAARRLAQARPIPLAAPVTSARRPRRSRSLVRRVVPVVSPIARPFADHTLPPTSSPRPRNGSRCGAGGGGPAGSEAEAAGDGVLPDAGGAGVAADDLQGRPAAGLHQLLVGGDRAGLDRGAGAQAVTAVPERRLQPGPAGGALHRAVDGQVGEAQGALDRGGGVVADAGARVDGPEGRPVVEAGGRAPGEPRPDGAGLRVVAVGDRADVDAGLGIALAAVDRVVDADLEPLRDQDEVADVERDDLGAAQQGGEAQQEHGPVPQADVALGVAGVGELPQHRGGRRCRAVLAPAELAADAVPGRLHLRRLARVRKVVRGVVGANGGHAPLQRGGLEPLDPADPASVRGQVRGDRGGRGWDRRVAAAGATGGEVLPVDIVGPYGRGCLGLQGKLDRGLGVRGGFGRHAAVHRLWWSI